MRVPMSWLTDYVALPPKTTSREVAERLIRAGLEVEEVDEVGAEVTGPLVVGRVLSFVDETHSNGKTIRWCHVDVGPRHNVEPDDAPPGTPNSRGVVCGAKNFAEGDLVVVALPGALLAGGFEISARKTYGHVSDGMICSARELGLGEDHTGIMVLPTASASPGDDAIELLGIRQDVLDIAVTPDRGYCLSVRGVAREVATTYDLDWFDPAAREVPALDGSNHPVRVDDPSRCPVFVARSVTGFDPAAPSPRWLQRRVQLAGMRPISLAVDVTNYVMLELGQPIHGYDATGLQGAIVVRRAAPGERLTTLDGIDHALDPDDLVIADDSGAIGLAGVMGGGETELGPQSRDIVIQAANFEATGVARTARRHRLPSEASRRFERGVDPALPGVAATRVADLLAELGGGAVDPGATVVGEAPEAPSIDVDLGLPSRVVGVDYSPAVVRQVWEQIGAVVEARAERPEVTGHARDETDLTVRVQPPTWRPDLTDPNDLVEEVARLVGYDTVPSVIPVAPAGRGISEDQRLRRRVERSLAEQGYVEAPCYPFVGGAELDALGIAEDDPRRQAVLLANPLSDDAPMLRTTLLPGLLATIRRNIGRGQTSVQLYESGLVFRPVADGGRRAPRLGVDERPSEAELKTLEQAVPHQPRHIATVACGAAELPGWWGEGRAMSWADAIESARTVAHAAGVELEIAQAEQAPWHSGRCAALRVQDRLVGHAGELHPRVVTACGLPARTVAMEMDLEQLAPESRVVTAPAVSTYPVATQDVALVVEGDTPAAAVEEALRRGAGPLLETLRLFDVYEGDQVGADRKSLAYTMRFRATDRTLTADEASAARASAVQEAESAVGAQQRGGDD